MRRVLPYFWDLVISAAQQEWDEFVQIGVSVSHVQKPVANNCSDSFPHLGQSGTCSEVTSSACECFTVQVL